MRMVFRSDIANVMKSFQKLNESLLAGKWLAWTNQRFRFKQRLWLCQAPSQHTNLCICWTNTYLCRSFWIPSYSVFGMCIGGRRKRAHYKPHQASIPLSNLHTKVEWATKREHKAKNGKICLFLSLSWLFSNYHIIFIVCATVLQIRVCLVPWLLFCHPFPTWISLIEFHFHFSSALYEMRAKCTWRWRWNSSTELRAYCVSLILAQIQCIWSLSMWLSLCFHPFAGWFD